MSLHFMIKNKTDRKDIIQFSLNMVSLSKNTLKFNVIEDIIKYFTFQ